MPAKLGEFRTCLQRMANSILEINHPDDPLIYCVDVGWTGAELYENLNVWHAVETVDALRSEQG